LNEPLAKNDGPEQFDFRDTWAVDERVREKPRGRRDFDAEEMAEWVDGGGLENRLDR
jgi:hypothetical protein